MEVILSLAALAGGFYFIFILGPKMIANRTGRPVSMRIGRFGSSNVTYPKGYLEQQEKIVKGHELIREANQHCINFKAKELFDHPNDFASTLRAFSSGYSEQWGGPDMTNPSFNREASKIQSDRLTYFILISRKLVQSKEAGELDANEFVRAGQKLYEECIGQQ